VPPDAPFGDLLRAAAHGAPWAQRELWHRFAPGVAGFARAQGSRDPDDVTSEVFLAVFRALPRFEGDEAGFRALVYTIARRRVLDERRRRGRRAPELEWKADTDPRHVPSAEQDAVASESSRQARALLDTLPPDQREVLVLRLFGDLTVDQVARAVGKSPGAVKALQRRGLERLRRLLGAYPPGATGLQLLQGGGRP